MQPELWPTLQRMIHDAWSRRRFSYNQDELSYARNVWDMQVWNGKIYIGHGNSSNREPASNAGPIPIVTYDPVTEQFETTFTVDEEQIDRFRIINGQVYIPGHDPLDGWELGNFYRLTSKNWEKVRTIPMGIHTYDMLSFQDTLFAALGTTKGAMVSRSADNGQTWASVKLPNTPRAYELFTLKDKLYVSAYKNKIFRYINDSFEQVDVNLFPKATPSPHPLIVRSTHFKKTLIYIGADRINDHQWHPFGIYKATQIDRAQPLNLPSNNSPYDILVQSNTVYILTNRKKEAHPGFTGMIYGSKDLETWIEIVRFNIPSLARSFVYYTGSFYIGLGTDTIPLNPASGNIYRVRNKP